MRNWMQNMRYKLQGWMQGRYGNDELSQFLSVAGLIILFLSFFRPLKFLYSVALVILIYSWIRCFSRKIDKRQKERDSYLRIVNKVRRKFHLYKNRWKERKTYHYYKCKNCGILLRIPKGKGHVVITCPKCNHSFEKNA